MAKYKRRPKEIEVYKYEDSSMSSNECDYYPYWVEDALKDGTLYYVEEDNNALYCCTIDGFRMKVEVGYYIVKLPDNSIATCSEEYLNQQYEFIEDDECEESSEIWSWNETDDESWSHGTFDSREEAIEDALGNIEEIKSYLETDTPTIYLGRCEYVPLPTSVDSEDILMDLDEQYCSETGCENYIYECVTDEQTKWLEDKLSDLMLEFHKIIGLNPCWFTVVEQEEIDLCEYEKEK